MKKSSSKKSSHKRKTKTASRRKMSRTAPEKIGTACPLCGHCHTSWICK